MRSWGKLAVWALLLMLLGLIPIALGWAGLPDPVATHWGANGQPDGAMSRSLIWLLSVGMALLGLVIASLLRSGGRPSAEGFAILGFMGGVGLWLTGVLVVLNDGVATWEDAGSFTGWHVVGVIVMGSALGAIGYAMGKRIVPPRPPTAAVSVPVMELADGERAAWTGTARVWWPVLVLVPLAILFLFLPGWLKLLAPVYVTLAYLFSKVSVVVDHRGLRVKLGGLVTAKTVGLGQVLSARPIDLEPSQWAGWGYRVVPGGSAIVLRRGDAIEVVMRNNRRFAVTVDDAATGSALLNGLAGRLTSQN